MRIAEIIKLLASPYATQASFLGTIPENAAAADYTKHNSVYRMAVLYRESITICEGDGGTEGEASWLARTGFTETLVADRKHPLWQSLRWLTIALDMLMELDKPFLFTKHGLRSAYEWKLVRHLAAEVCHVMSWPLTMRHPSFEALWNDLGAGVLDE